MKHQVQALVKQTKKSFERSSVTNPFLPFLNKASKQPQNSWPSCRTDQSGKPQYSGVNFRYVGMGQQLTMFYVPLQFVATPRYHPFLVIVAPCFWLLAHHHQRRVKSFGPCLWICAVLQQQFHGSDLGNIRNRQGKTGDVCCQQVHASAMDII